MSDRFLLGASTAPEWVDRVDPTGLGLRAKMVNVGGPFKLFVCAGVPWEELEAYLTSEGWPFTEDIEFTFQVAGELSASEDWWLYVRCERGVPIANVKRAWEAAKAARGDLTGSAAK